MGGWVLRGKGKSREKGSVFSQATVVPERDGRPSLARGRPTDKANQPGGCSCQSDTLEGEWGLLPCEVSTLAHSDTNVHVECCHAGCPAFQNCHVSEALGKVPFPADPSRGSAPIRRLHGQGDESASSTGRL